MAGQRRVGNITKDIVGMSATASYLKFIHPYPILRGNSCKSSTGACKIYVKCAGSQYFTVESTGYMYFTCRHK